MNQESLWVEVFYDGDCPLCRREISMLQRKDHDGNIQFTNIADSGFDPAAYGMTMDDFMSQIQGRLSDGRWITGVEVFRRLYTAIGFGTVVKWTRWPGISHLLDFGYHVFARNRLAFTGRECQTDQCAVG